MNLASLFKLRREQIFVNSAYLMFSTVALAGFGFIFWFITARLFSDTNIGLATTLISAMNLISLLSLIGFGGALVRFLPKSKDQNATINTGMTLVGITAFILSSAFVFFIPYVSTQLLFVSSHPLSAIAFVVFCVCMSLNTLTDAVFLSHLKTQYILIINVLYSLMKIAFPLLFIPFGAIGIFAAAGVAQAIGLALSVALMMRFFGYSPRFLIDMDTVREVFRYSLGNYIASSLNLLPVTLLPIIITNNIGPASAAYYYIAIMIANLLYTIPWSVTRSLFAEGSRKEHEFAQNLNKAVTVIGALIIPAIIVLCAVGAEVLRVFGKSYADGGDLLLYLFAISAIPVSAYAVVGSYFLIKKDSFSLAVMNGGYALVTIGVAELLISYGLTGIGFAWLIGNSAAAFFGYLLVQYPLNFEKRFDDLRYELECRIWSKVQFIKSWLSGKPVRTVLFYPDTPSFFHALYIVSHICGVTMTNDPTKKVSATFYFRDTTHFKPDETLIQLKKTRPVLNGGCVDISKIRVEEIFSEVFGYGTRIDPRTHNGVCVKKSDTNAMHDGAVIKCPTEPEPGYIYQKLINNQYGDEVRDIRLVICNGTIPFVCERMRSASDRFDHTKRSAMCETSALLSPEEIRTVLQFTKRFGFDWGEIDALRDRDDGKLYLVDVNNTSGVLRPGFQGTWEEYTAVYKRLAHSFETEILGTSPDTLKSGEGVSFAL